MPRRFAALVAPLVLALALLGAGGPPPGVASAPAAACRAFPETGRQVCDRFLAYWEANGGLAQQGLPLTDPFVEVSAADGKAYTVQYFERARFEAHPENAAPYDVLLGLLGLEQYTTRHPGIVPPVEGDPFAGDDGDRSCARFDFTGETVCGPFLRYWREHGGLAQQGYPIGPVFLETNPTNGRQYPTQYFERARFEFHVGNVGTPYAVLLGQLGREAFGEKYPYGPPFARDDFADQAGGWSAGPQPAGSVEYAEGGLRLTVAQPNGFLLATSGALPAPADLIVAATARKRGGPDGDNFGFGLACRVQDARNFYLLEISGGGLYGIVKIQDGKVVPLRVSNGAASPAVRRGNAANQLAARCVGDRLALIVNGQTVAEARDGTFGGGKFGLVAGAYDQAGLTVVFDDLALFRP